MNNLPTISSVEYIDKCIIKSKQFNISTWQLTLNFKNGPGSILDAEKKNELGKV